MNIWIKLLDLICVSTWRCCSCCWDASGLFCGLVFCLALISQVTEEFPLLWLSPHIMGLCLFKFTSLWFVGCGPYGRSLLPNTNLPTSAKHKFANISLALYCTVILTCTIFIDVHHTAKQFRLKLSPASLLFQMLNLLGDLSLRLCTWHFALFKYDAIKISLKEMTLFYQNNGKIKFALLLLTLIQETVIILLGVKFVQVTTNSKETDYLKLFSLSGHLAETKIYMALIHFLPFLGSNFIPVFIILGYADVIREEFHSLFCVINTRIESKSIFKQQNFVFQIKGKFYKIADAVRCVERGFQTYISVGSISFAIYLLCGKFSSSQQDVFLGRSCCMLLGFIISLDLPLCVLPGT